MFHYQMKVPKTLFNAIFHDLRDIYNRIDHEYIDFDHRSDMYHKMCYLFVSGEDIKQVPRFFYLLTDCGTFLKCVFASTKSCRIPKVIHFSSVNEVKAAIDKVIDGCTIKCKDGERVDGIELPCHRLLTK